MSALKLDCLLYHIFTIGLVLVSVYNAELKNTVTIDEHLHEVVDSPLTQAGPLLKEEFDPTERLLDRNVNRNFSVEFAVYRPRLSGGQYVFRGCICFEYDKHTWICSFAELGCCCDVKITIKSPI